jgi:hypothetical protein
MPKEKTKIIKKKKPYKKKLSILQRRAIENLVAGSSTKAEAIIKAGYSPKTARAPSKVFGSPVVKDALEEMLPEKMLLEKHKKLLDKEEIVVRTNSETGRLERLKTGEIDAQAVRSGLDMAYKLKGMYAPEKRITGIFGLDFSHLSDAELEEKLKEANKIIEREKMYKKEK